jgi:hypothetical protein
MSITFFEVKADRPAREICEVLRKKFLNLNTSDDRSIYEFAPRDNLKALINYLDDALIYASARLVDGKEKVLFKKQPSTYVVR